MNTKKGDLQISPVVYIILALVVLVIIGTSVYNVGKWQQWWGKSLPVPGQQNVTLSLESMTFRYAVANDRVEYYTGTAWEGFEGKNVDVGDKRINSDILKKNFKEYYFVYRAPETFSLPQEGRENLYGENYDGVYFLQGRLNVLANPDVQETYSAKGMVLGTLISKEASDREPYAQFIIDVEGRLFLKRISTVLKGPDKEYTSRDTSLEPYRTLVERAHAWRDSVFKKPVALTTGVLQSGKEVRSITEKYCVEKIVYQGELSLVVRLETPTAKEEC